MCPALIWLWVYSNIESPPRNIAYVLRIASSVAVSPPNHPQGEVQVRRFAFLPYRHLLRLAMFKSATTESPGRKVHKNLVKRDCSAHWLQVRRSSVHKRRASGYATLPRRFKTMASSLQTTWDIPSVSCLPVVDNSDKISRFEWISSDLGPLSKLLTSPHFLPSLQCLEEAISQERLLCQKLRCAVTAGHSSMMQAIYALNSTTEKFHLSTVPIIYFIPRPLVSLGSLCWWDVVHYYRALMDSILESHRTVPASKCNLLLRQMNLEPCDQLKTVPIKICSNILDCFDGEGEQMLVTSQECEISPETTIERMRALCHFVLSSLGLDWREFWGPEQVRSEEVIVSPDVPTVSEEGNSSDSLTSPAYSPVSSREISWSPVSGAPSGRSIWETDSSNDGRIGAASSQSKP